MYPLERNCGSTATSSAVTRRLVSFARPTIASSSEYWASVMPLLRAAAPWEAMQYRQPFEALTARYRSLGQRIERSGTHDFLDWVQIRLRVRRSCASPSVFGTYCPPKRLNHQAKCIRHGHALRHADRDLIPTLE